MSNPIPYRGDMKLKLNLNLNLNQIIRLRSQGKVIQQFGEAKLVRHCNGQHELIGGSNADRTAAFEWVSLFAHEIVFTHFYRRPDGHCRKSLTVPRLQPAL